MTRSPQLILLLTLSAWTWSHAQVITFEETALSSRHYTGYSILSDTSAGRQQYLLAGTIVEPGQVDSLDVHVLYTDDIGNILWEKTYDTGENERCLNVAHDSTGFVMTGFVDTMGTHHQVFALRIDASGNIVDQRRFESPFSGHTHGLDIHHTQDDGYVVVGFIGDGYTNADSKKAFVIKADANLNPVWSRYFDTPWDVNRDFDMAENVIEIPGQGYFVTGSVNLKKHQFNSPTPNTTDQGVMAIMLDLNGNLLWNSSFAAQDTANTGHWNVGVKAYFDDAANRIYLMSNNTEIHGFNITVFDLSGNILNHWEYSYQLNGLAGFDLIESGNANTLIACALATFYDFQLSNNFYVFNYPPILMEFNKSDGSMLWGNVYQVPSEYYGNFDNGFYTPISGQQPQLFTPDMAVRAKDGGYAVASYRSNSSSYFDLELLKTGPNGWIDCPHAPLNFMPQADDRYLMDSLTLDSGFSAAPVLFIPGNLPHQTSFCAEPDTCMCEIEPAFSYTTSDSCTYQFTDMSTVDSCYSFCIWNWDFGDGTYSSLQNPTHTYDTTGWYTVCLNVLVCGDNGVVECDSMVCQEIYVSCDTCSCEIEPLFSAATTDECTFQFTDMSLVDSCYDICSWQWDFGDGNTSALQHPVHSYHSSSNGWQTVCLQVTACDSLQNPVCDTLVCDSVYVSCDTCVCAIDPGFSYTTQDSCTFQFTDQSWVDSCFVICSRTWDFGDGNTSSSPNPTHTYGSVGWKTVCLSVSACDGVGWPTCDTTICMDIYVNCDTCECEIIPGFTYSIEYDSCAVSFTDQSHMADTCFNIWAWHWDFGDGNNSSSQHPSHTYSGSGTYTVCQTIYGGTPGTVGCDTTFCQEITLNCDTCICEIDPAFSYVIDHASCQVCFEDRSVTDSCVNIVEHSWDLLNDGTVVNQTMPCVHYSVNGTYTVCMTVWAVTDDMECDTTYCEDIDILCCDTVNGVSYLDNMDVVIYPNPFSERTTVRLSRAVHNAILWLYDPLGRTVRSVGMNGSIALIDRKGLTSGLYSVAISEKGQVIFQGRMAVQ